MLLSNIENERVYDFVCSCTILSVNTWCSSLSAQGWFSLHKGVCARPGVCGSVPLYSQGCVALSEPYVK